MEQKVNDTRQNVNNGMKPEGSNARNVTKPEDGHGKQRFVYITIIMVLISLIILISTLSIWLGSDAEGRSSNTQSKTWVG